MDSSQDGMVLLPGGNNASRTLFAVLAVVTDPGFPEDLSPKPSLPFVGLPAVFCVGAASLKVECMGGSAHADDGPSGVHVGGNVFHLLIGQLPEAREDD